MLLLKQVGFEFLLGGLLLEELCLELIFRLRLRRSRAQDLRLCLLQRLRSLGLVRIFTETDGGFLFKFGKLLSLLLRLLESFFPGVEVIL